MKKRIEGLGYKGKIKNLRLSDIYTIDKKLKDHQISAIVSLFTNPVTQRAKLNGEKKPDSDTFSFAIEIGYLPGVTDNVGHTAKEIIEQFLKEKFGFQEGVYSSQVLYLNGKLTKDEINGLSKQLINPLIQRVSVKKRGEVDKGYFVPKVTLHKNIFVLRINFNVSDEELLKIGKFGIKNTDGTRRGPLALGLPYMKAIQAYFKKLGRDPTDIEIESIAQTWSEHCKHTIFADPIDELKDGLFKSYIKKATEKILKKKPDFCVSVFSDNSGAIRFDKNYLITHKVETHNSPSALDPFGGAITGIGGVNRDAIGFGLGAKPVANTYGFCFADPRTNQPLFRDKHLTQKLLSPKRIMEGVIHGVNVGGNCSGIPTPQGFVYFDEHFRGKPLVFVGTVGLIPENVGKKKSFIKKAKPDDYIVMIGGKVGLDGIHGATFSSVTLDTESPATAVQIGDPITQKKLSDAIVKEARDLNLFNSITDNGAGGLSCSIAEMAKESGGCEVQLEKVPLKYPGLDPWQIWISESQERMTLAVPRSKWKKLHELLVRRGVDSSIIGTFDKSGRCIVRYEGRKIMDIDMEFLHNGLPRRIMKTEVVAFSPKGVKFPEKKSLSENFLIMLSRPNITSSEFISTQYDHEVQGSSVLKPLVGKGRVNADATVIAPLLSSKKGVALSQGLYPHYSEMDSYRMAAASIDTAVRNLISVGVPMDKIALLDNFCWCSSDDPHRLYQLKQSAKACYDIATSYETPFISGKDSMFNDFQGYDEKGNQIKISVLPTLLISSIGIIDDITRIVSIDFKSPDDLVYVVGETYDELGGSEYFLMNGQSGGVVPKVDPVRNKKIYKIIEACIRKNLLTSAIGIGRGGLAAALAKSALSGMEGVKISLEKLPGDSFRSDTALFSEIQGRILVSVDFKKRKKFEQQLKGVAYQCVGQTTSNPSIRINGIAGETIVNIQLKEAMRAYKSTFKNY